MLLKYSSCWITASTYQSEYFICRAQHDWHCAERLSRYMHIFSSPYYSFEKLSFKFKSMWLPTKPNIVTSTDLKHWHQFIACSDHITHFSMRFEANTCCYYDNTNSCGVLHTMNKCTFWYINIKTGKYACPIFSTFWFNYKDDTYCCLFLTISSCRDLMPIHVFVKLTPTAAVLNNCFKLPEEVLYLRRSTLLLLCRTDLMVHAHISPYYSFGKSVLQI